MLFTWNVLVRYINCKLYKLCVNVYVIFFFILLLFLYLLYNSSTINIQDKNILLAIIFEK